MLQELILENYFINFISKLILTSQTGLLIKSMKKNIKIITLLSVVILTFFSNKVFSKSSLVYSFHPNNIRSISIKILQQRLKACGGGKACPKELLQLGGLKRISGYVIDEEKQDLILIGETDPNSPPLYLEDFVIALRNAWFKYAPLRGNTYEYSYPGCSIDPNPGTIQKLQRIGQKITSSASTSQVEKDLESWHQTCREPQFVRVMGIPFNTHFAQVMVKADYDMKSIVDGSDSLAIPGLLSLTDMKLSQIRQAILQTKQINISPASLNRFWFYPGQNVYEEDEGIVWIKQSPVELLTEEMFVSRQGQLASGGKTDVLAHQFTQSFSKLYNKVAEARPIYLELENLFRLVALAQMIKFTSANEKAGLDLKYLLEDFPISQTKVSNSLPGRSAVKEFSHRQNLQSGYQIAQLWLPSCGGVSIAIQPNRSYFIQNPTGQLKSSRKKILNSRKSSDDVYWDVQDQPNGDLANTQISNRNHEINQANDNFTLLTVVDTRTDYEVYSGNRDPIYKGSDIPTLVKAISIQMEKTLKNTVYFDMKNFPAQDKIKAFQATTEIHLQRLKSNVTVRTLSPDFDFQEIYFSNGIRFDKQSSTIESVPSNKFRLNLQFLTNFKGRIKKLTVSVITKTRAIAEQFLKKIQFYFSPQLDSPSSLPDIINKIRWELKRSYNLKDEDIDILIEYESGGSQIVIYIDIKMEKSG